MWPGNQANPNLAKLRSLVPDVQLDFTRKTEQPGNQ